MRPSITAASISLALVVAACGSDGDGVVAGQAGAGVSADGADAAFVDQGDERPDGSEGPVVVSVTVDVPPEVDLAGTAIVALEDITYSDTESVEISRIELPAADLRSQSDRVELLLPLPLDGSIDVTATVHIDVDESGGFSHGDWISPSLAPVTTESVATGLIVGIVQI